MSLSVHRPYPGVALVVTDRGSVLLGAPADAFKAVKRFCTAHALPFPRTLVAPPQPLAGAVPQFCPEFFLYEFLFVYGAAFRPECADERLTCVVPAAGATAACQALEVTLNGFDREALGGMRDAEGRRLVDDETRDFLADVSAHMAIKKDGRPRRLDEMITTVCFDRSGRADVLGGHLQVRHSGPDGLAVRCGAEQVDVALRPPPSVVPYAILPPPRGELRPPRFGVKALGTRSGFDLSGPTTGFVLWLNGRGVLFDGPVGSRYLMAQQGICLDDIDAIVLSHCHEDHMGAFVELLLGGRRPKVLTSEPIYRAALIKLVGTFGRSEAEVAQLIDYVRVTPGQPLPLLGATLEFFYTVHAIPTLGLRATCRQGGVTRQIQISGDTLHHEGLDALLEQGVIGAARHAAMRELVPAARLPDALFFADVGEAIIHGHPKDWQHNPNQIVYYHCPDSPHTRGFGHPVAVPGEAHTLLETACIHPVTSARLLRALRFLDIDEPRWLATLLLRGRSRRVETGTVLAQHGAPADAMVSIVVAGTAAVLGPEDTAFGLLEPGDSLGLFALTDAAARFSATAQAVTPMELFDLDAEVVADYVAATGKQARIDAAAAAQPALLRVPLMRHLAACERLQLAAAARPAAYAAGRVVLAEGSGDDGLYLLVRGTADVLRGGRRRGRLRAAQADNFFGEACACFGAAAQPVEVRARTALTVLRLPRPQAQGLLANMAVRHALEAAARRRHARLR